MAAAAAAETAGEAYGFVAQYSLIGLGAGVGGSGRWKGSRRDCDSSDSHGYGGA